jgi:hypothetical protein
LTDKFVGTKRIEGKEYLVLFPSQAQKKGLSKHNEILRAAAKLYKEKWFLDLLGVLDVQP